jgi:hypothetical protein
MATPSRISHERLLLDVLSESLNDLPDAEIYSGLKPENRFGLAGWELALIQRFQFGDLRVELPQCTVVIEVESAGGVGNLVKYWPLLAEASLSKRFVLVHIFRLASQGDYVAHRRLWAFLVERMREDLATSGCRWPEHWEARAFTYRNPSESELRPALDYIRSNCRSIDS